ncbi:MAG: phytanoyl-CoA dioxygenase family protein [Pseudomonadota bacterium]
MVMTDEEKFTFDLEGYLVIRNVLTVEEIAELNRQADEIWPRQAEAQPFRRTADISKWGKPFLDLMDHPKVLPYLIELLGRQLRIDHDYCIFMEKSDLGMQLHGGPRRIEADHWYEYHDGVMRNGLMVATWNLSDALNDEGGFACVPGSHKTNFMMNLPRDVRKFEREAHYVRKPPMAAGDVLIFTEALIHGTAAWCGEHERRALLFKYSPGYQSWAKTFYNPDDYPEATEQQRRLMAPPSIEDHPRVVELKESPQ